MDRSTKLGRLAGYLYRLYLTLDRLGSKRTCDAFTSTHDRKAQAISDVHVINLDRERKRWCRIRDELERLSCLSGTRLSALAHRNSAVDARNLSSSFSPTLVRPDYSLADYLFVEPRPDLPDDRAARIQHVRMTRQEIAVALSHIQVWKRIASGDSQFALVLEDDIYFRREFARTLGVAWDDLKRIRNAGSSIDMLYLSYEEAKIEPGKEWVSDVVYRPSRGLWQLSGYVLSKQGARNLLQLLPVRGPVDLWVNHQFTKLEVYATRSSIIDQRKDLQSTNSYSILPVLTKLGLLTDKEPELFEPRDLPTPVIAFGPEGAGQTSLAMALSMLGYRCCSDVERLPQSEHEKLFAGTDNRIFDAYVNIGSLEPSDYRRLGNMYPDSKFIDVTKNHSLIRVRDSEQSAWQVPFIGDCENFRRLEVRSVLSQASADVLLMPKRCSDPWKQLSDFLNCSPPSLRYPELEDHGFRPLSLETTPPQRRGAPRSVNLERDSSPWIVEESEDWNGVPLGQDDGDASSTRTEEITFESSEAFAQSSWALREDTFPSNLALFDRDNFTAMEEDLAQLTLREESSSVRDYTSASLCSQNQYCHGSFSAVVKAATGSGVVTGIFLHRNSPRQEIDVEILGRDTTKMLVNVYYNPGQEGTQLEYGYRGTPALIDLGFDAADDLHEYTIKWSVTKMRWLVDGRVVHVRNNWNPTPIPHLPMQFNVNLWSSRSEELVGAVQDKALPAHSYVKRIVTCSESVSSGKQDVAYHASGGLFRY